MLRDARYTVHGIDTCSGARIHHTPYMNAVHDDVGREGRERRPPCIDCARCDEIYW